MTSVAGTVIFGTIPLEQKRVKRQIALALNLPTPDTQGKATTRGTPVIRNQHPDSRASADPLGGTAGLVVGSVGPLGASAGPLRGGFADPLRGGSADSPGGPTDPHGGLRHVGGSADPAPEGLRASGVSGSQLCRRGVRDLGGPEERRRSNVRSRTSAQQSDFGPCPILLARTWR